MKRISVIGLRYVRVWLDWDMLECVWIGEKIWESRFWMIWEKNVKKIKLFGLKYIK